MYMGKGEWWWEEREGEGEAETEGGRRRRKYEVIEDKSKQAALSFYHVGTMH